MGMPYLPHGPAFAQLMHEMDLEPLELEEVQPARIYPTNYLGDAPWMIPVRGWWRDPE